MTRYRVKPGMTLNRLSNEMTPKSFVVNFWGSFQKERLQAMQRLQILVHLVPVLYGRNNSEFDNLVTHLAKVLV